jgi:hypothetical protein
MAANVAINIMSGPKIPILAMSIEIQTSSTLQIRPPKCLEKSGDLPRLLAAELASLVNDGAPIKPRLTEY